MAAITLEPVSTQSQIDTLELICALQEELPRFSFLGNYSER